DRWRADTPSEPTANEPSGPAPDSRPVMRCVAFVCDAGLIASMEPVAPTHNSPSSGLLMHCDPPRPAAAMSNVCDSPTQDSCLGLFSSRATSVAPGGSIDCVSCADAA